MKDLWPLIAALVVAFLLPLPWSLVAFPVVWVGLTFLNAYMMEG